jgi:hypothetical protein
MTVYDFTTQLHAGADGEARLDAYFAKWYTIRHATRIEQRCGIDRVFSRPGGHFKVEYKTDATAASTGNAFVETVSVDTIRKAGWAYASEADYLIYYVPGPETIYIVAMPALRRELARWKATYPLRKIPNKDYHTHGLLVPLDEFERIAERVDSL